MKKLLSIALALVMVLGLGVTAFAEGENAEAEVDKDGNATGKTTVTLTAEPTILSATVPTTLAISVENQKDGTFAATVGKGEIINNSYAIIEVKSITLNDGKYTLTNYSTQETFNTYDVGSKQLGLSIAFGGGEKEAEVDEDGRADIDTQASELTAKAKTYKTGTSNTGTSLKSGAEKKLSKGTLKIAAKGTDGMLNTLQIVPEALVSPTGATKVENDDAATMVIVLGWYTGDEPVDDEFGSVIEDLDGPVDDDF